MSSCLQVLDLHNNQLEKLPDEIGSLKQLKVSLNYSQLLNVALRNIYISQSKAFVPILISLNSFFIISCLRKTPQKNRIANYIIPYNTRKGNENIRNFRSLFHSLIMQLTFFRLSGINLYLSAKLNQNIERLCCMTHQKHDFCLSKGIELYI